MLDILECTFPEVIKRNYPRKYPGVSGYGHPKKMALFFARVAMQLKFDDVKLKKKHMFFSELGDLLSEHGTPTYWVDSKLWDALEKTQPPKDLLINELKWPHPAMLFILPENCLVYEGNTKYSSLLVCRDAENSLLAVTGEALKPGILTVQHEDKKTRDLQERIHEEEYVEVTNKEETVVLKVDFLQHIGRMAINLLMLMSARPGMVEHYEAGEGQVRKLSEPRAKKSDWASPNWIGKNYKVSGSEYLGGSHSSPRMHWRRGHWRHQPHGPQLTLRKDIWLEPMMVKADLIEA